MSTAVNAVEMARSAEEIGRSRRGWSGFSRPREAAGAGGDLSG